MKRLIFATNNKHKVEEVRAALDGVAEVVTLAEAGLEGEIPETADTLQGNALQKAQWVWDRVCSGQCVVDSTRGQMLPTTHYPLPTDYDGVFADDTGLEVEALGGAPGVYSARYAGEHCSFDDNINKLLQALEGQTNRKACFRTVICLIEEGMPKYFEGRVDGQILTERHSNGEGFGYDPVFMPDRFALSFAEMPLEVKNTISHRGIAVRKLTEYLKR
ncbi:MAG: non-canonical purine NTP pyrophosphatase [Bacteroidales bacterium]|nr:non-canonical purine NTP pyrophosphatase [Bacteroidales bacterium]